LDRVGKKNLRNKGKAFLRERELPISQIALEVGFPPSDPYLPQQSSKSHSNPKNGLVKLFKSTALPTAGRRLAGVKVSQHIQSSFVMFLFN
jgi:AraC-like DNA-binding protein